MKGASANAKAMGHNPQWVHTSDALLSGRLSYSVKFYGDQQVGDAKGTSAVKEAIRKMKFNKQLRKAEGIKVTPKVDLVISVDGIALQDPKTKVRQFQFPLHHISYCADDKSEKKLFTFIAKDSVNGGHRCFVLGHERNAEEITLTIGQAFDLAYKQFLDKQNAQSEKDKLIQQLQMKVGKLEVENTSLKTRISQLEGQQGNTTTVRKTSDADNTLNQSPAVGTKLENLIFDGDFTADGNSPNTLIPPPNKTNGLHRPTPVPSSSTDAFGMPTFNPNDMADMQLAFSAGLSIGAEDFTLESLDPLNQL